MDDNTAVITYLCHSGYTVETAHHFFIFDYYQPSTVADTIADGVVTGSYLKTKSGIFVFASHSHADHFDRAILGWAKENPAITYILSDDIRIKDAKDNCRFMSPYQQLRLDGLAVKTYGSTDLGVSFLVRADGLSIFHAGDLNWWHWKGESRQAQIRAESAFKAELEKLASEHIDIAFFPVDPRLQEFCCRGAQYFADRLKPRLLIPMHFWNNYAATRNLADKLAGTPVLAVPLARKGQEIHFHL